MKTHPLIHRLLAGVACLVFALAGVSCRTNGVPPPAVLPATVTRSQWVKVSSRPPTYYPRGVAADCPTDHWSGEWVFTGDDLGTRYFIPFHGLGGADRQSLVHQALAARSERKLAQTAKEDDEILARNIRNMALFGPPTYAGLLLAAMGGATSFEPDVHRLQKEWDSSKQPH